MFHNIKPLKCSKCGSTNAVKPINDWDVAVCCGDCGHTKKTREAEQRELERKYPEYKNQSWQAVDTDKENVF